VESRRVVVEYDVLDLLTNWRTFTRLKTRRISRRAS